MSPDSFVLAEAYADTKTNLAPMSEIELWNYLNSRTLIDIVPSQVSMFLNRCSAFDMDAVLSVVRSSVAGPTGVS
jgi:hypothetical protein